MGVLPSPRADAFDTMFYMSNRFYTPIENICNDSSNDNKGFEIRNPKSGVNI